MAQANKTIATDLREARLLIEHRGAMRRLCKFTFTANDASGPEIDLPLGADEEVDSGRIAVYVNGQDLELAQHCELYFTLNRHALARPIYVGLATIAQPQFDEPQAGGTIVIAGWNPRAMPEEAADFLYVRGT